VRLETARRFALSLPETTEQPHRAIVQELLEDAWRRNAPKRVLDAYDAGDASA